MIILIFVICLILAICFLIHASHDRSGLDKGIGGGVLFSVLAGFAFIVAMALLIELTSIKPIPAKIDMYMQENAKIESQVSKYMSEHPEEKENELEFSDAVSDAMMKKQIDRYISNNEKIDELTDELAEYERKGSICRWWLYFGH